MPERIETASWWLLFDETRSLPALTRACTVKFCAVVPRPFTLIVCEALLSITPSAQVAVIPETSQPPAELDADSMAKPDSAGSVIVATTSSAARLPSDRTMKGSENGTPPSPVTRAIGGFDRDIGVLRQLSRSSPS